MPTPTAGLPYPSSFGPIDAPVPRSNWKEEGVTQLVLLTVDIDNIIKGERREYFFYLVYRSNPVVLSLILTSILVYCAGVEAFNWVPVRVCPMFTVLERD